ncbi:MAG: DMT family transporter [bacterium]
MAALWMLVSGLLFTAHGVFVKLAAGQFGLAELMLYRSLFIVAAIGLFAWSRGWPLRTPHWRAHFVRSFAGVVSMLLFFACLAHAPLATAVTLTYTSPLFLALITGLLLRERVAPLSIAAIVAGFAGVLALLQPWAGDSPLGPGLLGLAGGAVAAVAYLGIRRLGAAGEPEWRTVFYFALLGLVVGAAVLPVTGASPVRMADLPVLAGIGACALAAQLSMTFAFSRGATLTVATLSYSGVLFAGLFDLVAWQQAPSATGWLGMALIVGAGVMTVLARHAPAARATLAAEASSPPATATRRPSAPRTTTSR